MSDNSTFFRDSNKYSETSKIGQIQEQLSSLTEENYEEMLNFFQSSIIFTSKSIMKSFSRSLLNVIRFKNKDIHLYAELSKNLCNVTKYFKKAFLQLLKYSDFMTPSILQFYRLCILNGLFNEKEVIYPISLVLYFNITNTNFIDSLVPLFLWFLPEIHKYVPFIYQEFIEKVKIPYFSKLIEFLTYDNFFIFNQFFENEYLNLNFHYIYDNNNPDDSVMKMKKKSIEYCLKTDNLDEFQKLSSHIDLNSTCDISLFDLVLKPTKHPTLVQFAAYEGSFRCFNFLMLNHANFKIVSKNHSDDHIIKTLNAFQKKVAINKAKKMQEVIEILSSTDSDSNSEQDDVIVIDSSSGQESKQASSESENEETSNSPHQNESNQNSTSNNENCFTKENLEKKSEFMFVPPKTPDFLTSTANQDSCTYHPRKPLCQKYISSLNIVTTAQYAVAGGDTRIIRLIQDNDLSFVDTPKIAISCFHNDIARWLIEDVLFTQENFPTNQIIGNSVKTESQYWTRSEHHEYTSSDNIQGKILQAAITTGNIPMVEYIISNMPIEINDNMYIMSFIPLHDAIINLQVDVVSLLLNVVNIDVNIMDKKTQKTPFFLSIDFKSFQIMKMIASHPFFDFTLVSCHTIRPIHYLALYGTPKMLKYFLSLKLANINDNLMDIQFEDLQNQTQHHTHPPIPDTQPIEEENQFGWVESSISVHPIEIVNKGLSDDDRYYMSYACNLYDLSKREFFNPIPDVDNASPRFKYLFNTPIVCALLVNNLENFNILLNEPELNINEQSDQLILHILINRKNMQLFDMIISNKDKNHINLDMYDKVGTTALHYAIFCKNKHAVNQLLKNGSDPTLKTKYEEDTLLHLAARANSFELYKMLIEMKNKDNIPLFNVNQANIKGLTVLHYAVKYNSIEIANDLINNRNADVNVIDSYGNAPIHYAINNSALLILNSLLNCPSININVTNKNGKTPLLCAFNSNFEVGIRTLLLCVGKIDPNCRDPFTGNTPLHFAVSNKDENKIKLLLKLRHLDPALIEQCKLENPNSFQYEFSPETDVNCQNSNGLTPLHIASQNKYDQIVRVLLACLEIRLDIVDYNQGRCPLHFSAEVENNVWFGMKMWNQYMYSSSKFSNTIFRLLINHDPLCGNIQDKNGDTGFHLALRDKGFEGDIFKNVVVQTNYKSNGNCKALTFLDFENYEKNEILILTLTNNIGETYLHLAAASGNRIVLEFLMKVHPELVNQRTIEIFFFYNFFLWNFYFLFF